MEISFKEDENNVLFVVSNSLPEYKNVFESSFYSLENGSYVKRFPKNIQNMDKIKANFKKYAEDMFGQMGYFKEVPWEDALLDFINKVEGTDIDWWLTGSCATCLRGIDVQPHDIDIMLSSKDIDIINDIFGDYIVEPIRSSKGWVVNYFGVLFIGARIDLAFDPEDFVDNPEPVDFGPYAIKNLEEINWKGKIVKIPPLNLQLQVNKRRGRNDRVRAIEDYMNSNLLSNKEKVK